MYGSSHTWCALGFGSTYSGYGGYGGYGSIGGYGYRPFGMVGGYSGYGASGYGGEEDSHFIRQAEVINQMISVTIKKCTLFPAFSCVCMLWLMSGECKNVVVMTGVKLHTYLCDHNVCLMEPWMSYTTQHELEVYQ